MKPKISVIIPVYNSSKYIRECLDSILNQTLSDIEIICVDDGSTDDSYEILCEYQLKDMRIRILKQENMGAGAARNFGMVLAVGDYLSFLDSDDFFYPDMLERAYMEAEKNASDITIFGYNKYFENRSSISKREYGLSWWSLPKQEVFSFQDIPESIFDISTPCPWNKLFRRQFILDNNLQFQEIPKCNDLYFVFSAFYLADRISVVDKSLMSYRVGLESSLQSTTYSSPFDIYYALSAVHSRLINTPSWSLVEIGFINVALWQCIFQLDRLELCYPQQFSELLSLLVNDGFKKLGVSDHPKEDFVDKWIFWKYKNYISEYNLQNTKYSNQIMGKVYLISFYLRHIRFMCLRVGILNSMKYLCDIVRDSLKT